MGNFISSSAVNIFPTSLRGGEYSHGKFTTEYNLTRFLKSVTDKESFVIADPNTTPATDENPHYNPLYYIFVINGFYFQVDKAYIDSYKSDDLFASIRLDADGRLIAWDGTAKYDDEGYCKMLYVSTTIPKTTSEFTPYTLELTASDRFAKFTTDSFFLNDQSLTEVLDDKQDKFIAGEEDRQLDLAGDLVKNVLPVANGGTGASKVSDIMAGKAMHLVDDTGSTLAVGDATHPVYFNGGVPYKVDVVENAKKLNAAAGSSNLPVYVDSSGVVKKVSTTLNVHADGLNEGGGGKVSEQTSGVTTWTSVYFDGSGNLQEGITVTMSPNSPSGTGNLGDIWLKYQV